MNTITARPQTLELYGPPGALEELALEAAALLADPWKPHKFAARIETTRSFVRVRGASWDLACELASRLSTAHDLRLALPNATVESWDDLMRALKRWPWFGLLEPGETIELQTEAGQGVLGHALRLRELSEDFFATKNHPVLGDGPSTRINLSSYERLLRCQISLVSGVLHKRGWRAQTSTLATLREDLAAACLRRVAAQTGLNQAGPNQAGPNQGPGIPEPADASGSSLRVSRIVVPFAGSGTLGFEAWHALCGLPPAIWGLERSWHRLASPSVGTLNWWRNRTLRAAREAKLLPLTLIENNARQAEELRANITKVQTLLEQAGVEVPRIEVIEADVFNLPDEILAVPGEHTLMPLHPPYGLRLHQQDTYGLFMRLGRAVDRWGSQAALTGFCLCPDESLWGAFKARLRNAKTSTSHVTQGGLDVRVCAFGFKGTGRQGNGSRGSAQPMNQ